MQKNLLSPRWSEEEIEVLRSFGETTPVAALSSSLPRRSVFAIRMMLSNLGIRLDKTVLSDLSKQRAIHKSDQSLTLGCLSEEEIQILLGSVLGDAAVSRGSRHSEFSLSEVHSAKQADYVVWKAAALRRFHTSVYHNKDSTVRYCTSSHPLFSVLRDKCYRTDNSPGKKKKYLPLDIFRSLTLFGMFVWYLDDGYLGRKRKLGVLGRAQPYISVRSWLNADLVMLLQLLNSNYNLNLYLGLDGDRLMIPAKDRDVLFPLWNELACRYELPSCMSYKFVTY